MWCFVDESWHNGPSEKIGVLAAVIGPRKQFELLSRAMYAIRRKYYGEDHARDLRRELVGSSLFSNSSFRYSARGYSKNLTVAREVIEWTRGREIRLVGITVYGAERPPLLAPAPKRLSRPFRELCVRVLAAIPERAKALLVFDQRLGAQEAISIAVCNYLAGIRGQGKMIPHPCVGVSNVWPGLQLAGIAAHVLGRYATGDARFDRWYRLITPLQVDGLDHQQNHIYGLMRLQWEGGEKYVARRLRAKK
ncbi:MAG: hypothetical protein JXR96_12855 [Deltaproteobacteria bacterium]|nr:hypothetical protein [Deltaproteobacteria bacterium]